MLDRRITCPQLSRLVIDFAQGLVVTVYVVTAEVISSVYRESSAWLVAYFLAEEQKSAGCPVLIASIRSRIASVGRIENIAVSGHRSVA